MKKLLIVDDEQDIIWSLQNNLQDKDLNIEILTASSGEEALDLLKKNHIDLIITDIYMPGISGLDLIVKVKKHYPHIGVIVMTAYKTDEYEKEAHYKGCLHFIEKPFNFTELKGMIKDALHDNKGFDGTITGIELSDIIQLNCLSKNTSALKVKIQNKEGTIFFADGNIVHAIHKKLEGEEAFYEIMQFRDGNLESIKNTKSPTQTIDKNYVALLMEGSRRIDEQNASGTTEDKSDKTSRQSQATTPSDSKHAPSQKEDLHIHLQELKEVNGYKAAGIISHAGDMLISDSVDADLNFHIVAPELNNIYIEANEASKKIGFKQCKETVITTPKGIIVMQGTSDNPKPFNIIAILSYDGNQALMKLKIEQLIPSIHKFLWVEPLPQGES